MDKKEIAIFAGVAVIGGVGLFVAYKKGLFANLGGPSSDSSNDGSGTVIQNSAPSPTPYTASSTSYSAIPVGINTGANASNPVNVPGVSSGQTTLTTVPPYQNSGGNTVAGTTPSDSSSVHPSSGNTVATPAPVSNASAVQAAFEQLFGRDPATAGAKFWTDALNNGTINQSQLVQELTRNAAAPDAAAEVTRNPQAIITYDNKV